MDIYNYLSNLPDEFLVSVNCNAVDGDVIKLNGMAVNSEPPDLEILFGPESRFNPDRIDFAAEGLVFIETGEIVTLVGVFKEGAEKNALRFTVRKFIHHVEKREYFRSPAHRLETLCTFKSAAAGKQVNVPARGVNISSGGMLVVMEDAIQRKDRVILGITLPEPVTKEIKGIGTVLRVQKTNAGTFLVAIRFENADEIGDDIMKYCFAEQRRLLREQVLTKDMA